MKRPIDKLFIDSRCLLASCRHRKTPVLLSLLQPSPSGNGSFKPLPTIYTPRKLLQVFPHSLRSRLQHDVYRCLREKKAHVKCPGAVRYFDLFSFRRAQTLTSPGGADLISVTSSFWGRRRRHSFDATPRQAWSFIRRGGGHHCGSSFWGCGAQRSVGRERKRAKMTLLTRPQTHPSFLERIWFSAKT